MDFLKSDIWQLAWPILLLAQVSMLWGHISSFIENQSSIQARAVEMREPDEMRRALNIT